MTHGIGYKKSMKEAKYNVVYEIRNLINDKIYVGAHSTNNINDMYMGSGSLIKKAIKKYGCENFIRTILCFCDNRDSMFKKEAEIVNNVFVVRDDTYNLIIGGGCGDRFGAISSDETRRKISISSKGRRMTEEAKRKLSIFNTGKKLNPEHCRKISEAQKGKPRPNKVLEETKRKISKAQKGRKKSDLERLHISIAQKKRQPISEETRRKLSESHKGLKYPNRKKRGS